MKMGKSEEKRMHGTALGLLSWLEKAVAGLDEADRGSLKQLTGVMRDLQEILDHDLTVRERELKLKKMEQELCMEGQSLTVRLEGEVADFAQ